ncbi:MAG: HAD hydrolase-like protein [Bacteroidota bacterium]
MIKTILWDFDGVILNSMPIRDLGFEEIFKDYDRENVEKLLDFHRQNGGLSRYVKIKFFFQEVLDREISEEGIVKIASEFSRIMRKELVNQKYLIEETVGFIKDNSNNFNFHIVSGSDEHELKFLCQKLGLESYFISVHGSPTPKVTLVANLLDRYSYSNFETCLIGDSINDFEASKENMISFYGYNNRKLLSLPETHYIENFKEFSRDIRKH